MERMCEEYDLCAYKDMVESVVARVSRLYDTDPDDLRQEAYLALYKALINGRAVLGDRYLRACAGNAIRGQARKDRRFYAYNILTAHVDRTESACDDLTLVEVREIMRQAIERCEDYAQLRAVMAMTRKMEGISLRSTSMETGIPYSSVLRRNKKMRKVIISLV